MKTVVLLSAFAFMAMALAACGSDRTVVVQPQPAQTEHVVVEHDAN